MPSDNAPRRQPDLSVVIPAYNETAHLGNLIESIRHNLYDLDLEIIVVDNGSTDDTAELAQQAGTHLVKIPKDSISKARNIGAATAAAEVIAFIDADVRLTRSWAVTMKQRYPEIRDHYMITGSRYMIPENPSNLDKYWFEPLSEKEVTYINGGNLILSKTSFDKIGGFDEALSTGEDFEFCVRGRNRGAQINIDRELQSIHDGFPKTLLQFCKREIWHGIGDFQGLHRFLESKVAIAAVVFVLIHLFFIGALLSKAYLTALFFGLLLLLISFAVSRKIFRNSSLGIILHNTPYCYFYLISRFLSLPKLLLNKIS
ncbi:glycosyltransferase [Candidatus Thiodiazotropha endoloripes]|uniref:glycosyltransferase n=1 Tax=Candidatus Thiodiazotropha endoloripes TaxID=1818881 RepID=UPI0009F5F4B5|nr:glycosyltransferase [Candidatus Thiodiazotropha endoloripes]